MKCLDYGDSQLITEAIDEVDFTLETCTRVNLRKAMESWEVRLRSEVSVVTLELIYQCLPDIVRESKSN